MKKPSPQDIHDTIAQFEKKYAMLDYHVGGWRVWPLFRFRCSLVFYDLPLAKRKTVSSLTFIKLLVLDLWALRRLRKTPLVAVSFSSARADQENGLFKDIWFDDVFRRLGGGFKIEKPNNPLFLFPKEKVLLPSQFYGVFFRVLGALTGIIGGVPGLFPGEKKTAAKIHQALCEGLTCNAFTKKQIFKRLINFKVQKALYAALFRRLEAKVLLSADGYGDFDFFAAAKEAGMTTIEMQHGFIDRFHCGYSWSGESLGFAPQMPLADQIFSFGDFWRREIEFYGFWRDRVQLTGHVWLDSYRQKKAHNKIEGFGARPKVVVTTQGLDTEKLVQYFNEFLRLLSAKGIFIHLVFKLHPILETETKAYRFTEMNGHSLDVILGNAPPSTHALISQANLHCSISSSCHYDALALGVPTVILPFDSQEILFHLVEQKYAHIAQTPADLIDLVLGSNQAQQTLVKATDLYQENALENVCREIEQFI